MYSRPNPVKTRTLDKNSVFTGYKYVLSDSIICRSVYDTSQHREIFSRVDKMPLYENSVSDMIEYIRQNVKYPDTQADVSGNV